MTTLNQLAKNYQTKKEAIVKQQEAVRKAYAQVEEEKRIVDKLEKEARAIAVQMCTEIGFDQEDLVQGQLEATDFSFQQVEEQIQTVELETNS